MATIFIIALMGLKMQESIDAEILKNSFPEVYDWFGSSWVSGKHIPLIVREYFITGIPYKMES